METVLCWVVVFYIEEKLNLKQRRTTQCTWSHTMTFRQVRTTTHWLIVATRCTNCTLVCGFILSTLIHEFHGSTFWRYHVLYMKCSILCNFLLQAHNNLGANTVLCFSTTLNQQLQLLLMWIFYILNTCENLSVWNGLFSCSLLKLLQNCSLSLVSPHQIDYSRFLLFVCWTLCAELFINNLWCRVKLENFVFILPGVNCSEDFTVGIFHKMKLNFLYYCSCVGLICLNDSLNCC